MSRTTDNKGLKIELSFIPDEAKVFCRGFDYGYQLVFKWGKDEEARIFIADVERGRNTDQPAMPRCPYCRSTRIRLYGMAPHRDGSAAQRYICQRCERTFQRRQDMVYPVQKRRLRQQNEDKTIEQSRKKTI